MRIAYVCADPGVPIFGQKGCSIHVQEVLQNFRKRNMDVELFASRTEGVPPRILAGVNVRQLSFINRRDQERDEKKYIKANEELYELLDKTGPYDLVYERHSLWSYSAMKYARNQKIPGILEINAPLIEEEITHRRIIDVDDAKRIADQAFGYSSALVVVSRQVALSLKRLGHEVDFGKVHIIPNGVNAERFQDVSSMPKPDFFTVGFVGSLRPWHGLADLVDAFDILMTKIKNARLLIVGDGPQREDMERRIDEKKLNTAVVFTGAIEHHQVPEYLSAMHVAVAPYPRLENFYFSPLKIFEYMAAGLPVVASNIGQIPEIVRHGETGLLCPPGNSMVLAEAIEWLYRNPLLRDRMALNGQQWIVANHTWDRTVDQILGIAGLSRVKTVITSGG